MKILTSMLAMTSLLLTACGLKGSGNTTDAPVADGNDTPHEFWLGADLGWCTQLEAEGHKLYNWEGQERDAIGLMKEMGLMAVRLRVWVDPSAHGGWCDTDDTILKAHRAIEAGMEVMLDFHYSDWWADPGKQNIPAAWKEHDYAQMQQDVRQHTLDVLQRMKQEGITPRWVQVGNETSNGMLWPMGHLQENPEQYAGLFRAGAEAVKEVFPDTKVIVHLDNGFDRELYVRNLDVLRQGGCKWDIVGMSLYPYWAMQNHPERTAQGIIDSTLVNIGLVAERYACDVMIVETGFEVDDAHPEVMEMGRDQLAQVIDRARCETQGHCLGVFYWEPCCRPSMYKLGAFHEDGTPTQIMRAFDRR